MSGGRDIARTLPFYNLDMVIAVGYRVNPTFHVRSHLCDLPARAKELDCSEEDAWRMVESGEITE